jgi:hypothetical protein
VSNVSTFCGKMCHLTWDIWVKTCFVNSFLFDWSSIVLILTCSYNRIVSSGLFAWTRCDLSLCNLSSAAQCPMNSPLSLKNPQLFANRKRLAHIASCSVAYAIITRRTTDGLPSILASSVSRNSAVRSRCSWRSISTSLLSISCKFPLLIKFFPQRLVESLVLPWCVDLDDFASSALVINLNW